MAIIRKFDEPILPYKGEKKVDGVLSWMYVHEQPAVIEFSEKYIEKVFKHGHPSTILFYKEKESALVTAFTKVAKENYESMSFVTSGNTEGIQQKIASFVGVKKSPTLVIIKPPTGGEQEQMQNFKFDVDETTTQEEIQKHIQDFLDGEIKPSLKSEPEPYETNDPVKIVVGTTHARVVTEEAKDVLMMYYAPFNPKSDALQPIWE